MTVHDVVAIGRVSVDLYPLQHGVTLDEVRTFEKFLGGSAANVTVAAARHGRRAALVSATAADAFGRFVHRELLQLGVDDAYVQTITGGPPTPVTFCEIFPPDHFPTWSYRYPTAPDLLITPESLPLQAIREARVYWSTLTGLSQEPSRAAHLAAWEERGRAPLTVLDLDYRPAFWSDRRRGPRQAREALRHATVASATSRSARSPPGSPTPSGRPGRCSTAGVELAVVTQGPRGVLAMTPSEQVERRRLPRAGRQRPRRRATRSVARSSTALLEGWDLERILHFATVAGALVAGRLAVLDGDADDGRGAGPAVGRRGRRRRHVSAV